LAEVDCDSEARPESECVKPGGEANMALQVTDELKAAIALVRDDSAPEDYVLAAYEDDSTLTVASVGTGGIEAMKDQFLDSDINYGLVRKSFNFEKAGTVSADTVKFVFIVWRPEIPLKRKMMIGRFDGAVKKGFSPYHLDMDINAKDEVSEDILSDLIAELTMTKDHVTEKKSKGMYLGGMRLSLRRGNSDAAKAKLKPNSRAEFKVIKGASVTIEDADSLDAAIKEVRSDASPIMWCYAAYKDKATIALVDSGTGDVSEMLERCKDTQPGYGLFRVTEKFDKSTTTKFCFVVWTPPNIPIMMKAKISTHAGTVYPLFRPYHVDFVISDVEELSDEIAKSKIGGLTGTRSHVTTRKSIKVEKAYARKFLGGVKNETQKLQFVDHAAIAVAIADVRSDSNETNWCVAGFSGENKDIKFGLVAKGSNGFHEMLDCFQPDQVMFGLIRYEEVVDRSVTIKFSLVQWSGNEVDFPTKGRTGVYTGAVLALFAPYHDDVKVSDVDDLTSWGTARIQNL